jgi:type IV pilus assembly protein PilX
MKSKNKQSGAVLIVGLIMVLVLSVVVIASSHTTVLQQKMSSNLRDKELAFQSAETALRAGERFLDGQSENALKAIVFDGNDGHYNYSVGRALTQEDDWQNLNTIEAPQKVSHVKEKPVYIIENITGIKPVGGSLQAAMPVNSLYYRVTAKSKGGTDASLAILQTVYKK